jgi:hypothetical protein
MASEKLLKFSIIPVISLFVFSLVSIILTTHYWILGEYIMGRLLNMPTVLGVPTMFDEDDRERWAVDPVIVDYSMPVTDATITAGCLGLGAAVWTWAMWRNMRNHKFKSSNSQTVR